MPALQTGGQVAGYSHSRGFPIASLAALGKISQGFRAAVRRYADSNGIPWMLFRKGDRKLDVMRLSAPHHMSHPPVCSHGVMKTASLLWAVLAAEATARRRTWVGLAGFAALEAAVFVRYTDIVVLGCAVVAVAAAAKLRAVPAAVLRWWLGSVAACIAAVTAALFGLGAWSFTVMRESPIGGIHKAPPGVTRQTVPGRQPGA